MSIFSFGIINDNDFTAAGQPLENPAAIEALTFWLRLLYRDDRLAAPPGGIDGRVFVNGNYVGSFSMTGGTPTLLPGPTWYAREGEVVTIERIGGSAVPAETFFLRCWIENIYDG